MGRRVDESVESSTLMRGNCGRVVGHGDRDEDAVEGGAVMDATALWLGARIGVGVEVWILDREFRRSRWTRSLSAQRIPLFDDGDGVGVHGNGIHGVIAALVERGVDGGGCLGVAVDARGVVLGRSRVPRRVVDGEEDIFLWKIGRFASVVDSFDLVV